MRSEETINKNFGNLNDKMTFKILSICKKNKKQKTKPFRLFFREVQKVREVTRENKEDGKYCKIQTDWQNFIGLRLEQIIIRIVGKNLEKEVQFKNMIFFAFLGKGYQMDVHV